MAVVYLRARDMASKILPIDSKKIPLESAGASTVFAEGWLCIPVARCHQNICEWKHNTVSIDGFGLRLWPFIQGAPAPRPLEGAKTRFSREFTSAQIPESG